MGGRKGRRGGTRRRGARRRGGDGARRGRFLAAFGAYFVLLWLLWDSPVVYPLKLFVVLMHEISHGLLAVATGGAIQRIVVTPDQGGLCVCGGGDAFLTLSAGYLGSLAWGGALLEAARRGGVVVRGALGGLAALLLATAVLWVRGPFGLSFTLLFAAALAVAAVRLPTRLGAWGLEFLGLTSCLYAVLDIKSDILDRPRQMSDAALLAELTAVPTVVWGAVWISVAVLAVAWLLRRAWRAA